MIRTTLTDTQRGIIASHCIGRECDPGRTGPDPKLFVRPCSGVPEPGAHGVTYTQRLASGIWVFNRFRRWVKEDAFYRRFRTLAKDADFEDAMIDGSIVKIYRHGQSAKARLKVNPLGALAATQPPESWR